MSKQNVEALVIEWLSDIFPDYSVSSDVPDKMPEKFMLVERQGGPRIAMLGDSATIAIEVYNKNSRFEASEKASEIGDRIIELRERYDDITRATINSIVSGDDTYKKFHRYTVYCDVFHSRISDI